MAEKQYIERDEAYKIINEAMTAGMVNIFSIQQRRANFEEVLEVIEEIPTADVQEVKHGRWEETREKNILGDKVTVLRCSVCNKFKAYGKGITVPYDYCPHCGARMDGEENG